MTTKEVECLMASLANLQREDERFQELIGKARNHRRKRGHTLRFVDFYPDPRGNNKQFDDEKLSSWVET